MKREMLELAEKAAIQLEFVEFIEEGINNEQEYQRCLML